MKRSLLFIASSVSLFVMPFASLAQAPNLVLNGGFENFVNGGGIQNFSNWTELPLQPDPPGPANYGGLDITQDGPATTNNMFPINNNITCRLPSISGQREIKSDPFTIIPGKTYRLTYTYRIRLSNTQSGPGGVTTSNFQADVYSSYSPDPNTGITPPSAVIGTNFGNSNTNVTVTKDISIPANADYTKVYINLTKFATTTATANAVAWVDDVKFQDLSLLPISLSSFTGKSNSDGVDLNWTTTSEINNDKFILSRSQDGKSFKEIATVKGKGNSSSTNTYSFKDLNPISGINYYQIKQVDFDGKSEEFKPIFVDFKLSNSVNNLSIYATNSKADLKLNWQTNETVNIIIYDLNGKTLYSKSHQIEQGLNNITLNFDNLSNSGFKIMKVIGSKNSEVTKFNIN